MTWMDNFVQATVIMCLGMGLVFLFVASLVVLIQISARILSKYAEDEALAAPTPAPASAAANNGAIVAAIAMALHKKNSPNT